MKILIVKTSSLGDIIQSFPVLNELHARFPKASLHWLVDARFADLVAAHPLVARTLSISLKIDKWKAAWKEIRKERYQLVFDLQANCKSGILTALVHGEVKVGFDFRSVREWPNIFATHVRFPINPHQNIRLQYLSLLTQFFQTEAKSSFEEVRFQIDPSQQALVQSLLQEPQIQTSLRFMVCPGSKWINKQIPIATLIDFLQKVQKETKASYLLVWGNAEEKRNCQAIHHHFPESSLLVEKLPLVTWQYLMREMDLILAVDSSALHLCGTTKTPSFSVFGPTAASIFKPLGSHHFSFQGICPYGKTFPKQCPLLRSCSTGACISHLTGEQLFQSFFKWFTINTLHTTESL